MNSDKKAIAGVIITCFILVCVFAGSAIYLKMNVVRMQIDFRESVPIEIRDTITPPIVVESVWKMWTQDVKQGYAFAELFRVGDQWYLSTNLPVNRDELFYVLKVCQDSSINIPEMMQTVWRESRIGCNLQYTLNYDGSIDGGWFGLNSRYHPIKTLGDPKKDIYLYITYVRKNLDPYPDGQRYARYVYGERKAKELGLIK